MNKILFLILLAIFMVGCENNPTIDSSVIDYVDKIEELPPVTVQEEDQKAEKMSLDQVPSIDSMLFEKSIFREIGCSRDFFFGRKGPECCCEEVLTNYTGIFKNMPVQRLAALNAKDPLIKKCRNKMKGWGKRFDNVATPPETEDSKLPPSKDEGI
jgi:hypothetical protein